VIFVTVGTHEQPFDRLVERIDGLCADGVLDDEIFIQTGYTKYEPEHCEFEALIDFDRFVEKIESARIVITHGGPGSIMTALYHGKLPVVVPRQKRFAEHVDDHQVRFTEKLEKAGRIIAVYNIENLAHVLRDYAELCANLRSSDNVRADLEHRIRVFTRALDVIAQGLLKDVRERD
jgi:UDP-N-acetylglucosamine transferase subunit ALG13